MLICALPQNYFRILIYDQTMPDSLGNTLGANNICEKTNERQIIKSNRPR